jgi:hypothetical protein
MSKEENDLFYTCSLIEYIARKTLNTKKDIINIIGKDSVARIYRLADVYHCENIDKVSDEYIEKFNIQKGNYHFDNYKYRIPTYFEIGKVYERLIVMVNPDPKEYVDTTVEVLTSWIIPKIDNYNSSMYYENPQYIYACYKEGYILE